MPINPATNPAPLAHEVTNLPGGVQPAAGAFSMVDDDLLKDGDEVPLPDTSTLTDAMKE
jgi:hypothetical protein